VVLKKLGALAFCGVQPKLTTFALESDFRCVSRDGTEQPIPGSMLPHQPIGDAGLDGTPSGVPNLPLSKLSSFDNGPASATRVTIPSTAASTRRVPPETGIAATNSAARRKSLGFKFMVSSWSYAAANRCLLALYSYMCRWRGGPDRNFWEKWLVLVAGG
jgi:hypothetical protein